MLKDYFRHEILEITFYITMVLLLGIVLPIFVGFSLRGFEGSFVGGRPLEFGDIIVSFMIYYIFIVVALFGIPTLKIREMLLSNKREHPANQSIPHFGNYAIIHDPI